MGTGWKHAGKQDAAQAKGKIISKLAKELIVASKFGGADPTANPRLRVAMEQAKKASMPKDTMERAIKKGAGLLDEPVTYETVMYEGFAPHRVPVIVECLTDNKNRTATNIRLLFRKTQLSAVAWDFKRAGAIEAVPPGPGIDAETAAIEAGAQEVGPGEEGAMHFVTEPTDLDSVQKALTAANWKIESAQLVWIAKNPVKLEPAARAEVEEFLAELDADDDVQHLFVGLAP